MTLGHPKEPKGRFTMSARLGGAIFLSNCIVAKNKGLHHDQIYKTAKECGRIHND